MPLPTNFQKHTTGNPISRIFLNNFFNVVISVVKPFKPETVLDVGCGEGFTLARLKKEGIGKKLEGIESEDASISLGKKIHPDVIIKKGSIYKLPYKDNSFDLVLCTEVLEHLKKPKEGLKQLIRVSNQYVLLTVPNEPYFTIQRFIRGKNILKLGDHPEHVQHWTSFSFEQFVLKEKVQVIIKKHPFPWTMLLLKKY